MKILIPLLAAFLISSPALASTDLIVHGTKAPVTAPPPVCRMADKVIEDAVNSGKVNVKADLTGDALKKFNDAYATATGVGAPGLETLDRVTVFESKNGAPYYLILFSLRDCVVGGQPISKEEYEKFAHPGDAI